MKENFVLFIESSIKKNWDINAFSDYKGDGYKYSDVAYRIARIHIAFEEGGVKKGDKIPPFNRLWYDGMRTADQLC